MHAFGPSKALKNRPPETTSSGVPFAEPLLANSRNSSTDALRFPIRFNRAIGRPLNSLEPPRIPDPSPERSQWPTAPPPPPSTSGICLPALWPPMGKAVDIQNRRRAERTVPMADGPGWACVCVACFGAKKRGPTRSENRKVRRALPPEASGGGYMLRAQRAEKF